MATSQELPKIPIFDLSSKNLNPSSSSWLPTCRNLQQALEELGFFVATYENVSLELDKEVFHVLEEVFNLPLETKTRNTSDLVFYGYVGQLPHAPLHESMGIPEATTLDAVQSFTNLMWPSGNKDFWYVTYANEYVTLNSIYICIFMRVCASSCSENILCYARLVSELEQLVDRMVFESYGAEKHYDSHVGSTTYLLRFIKYSVPEVDAESNNVGTNVHTDKSFLSILHQNQVNGLQIQLRNGEWLDVDVPPGSFIVMAGDAYEV